MIRLKPIKGVVVEMDISHMRAAVLINGEEEFVADAKVGTIYDPGDEVIIFDVSEVRLPWYLQGTEFMDANPISQAEVFGGV